MVMVSFSFGFSWAIDDAGGTNDDLSLMLLRMGVVGGVSDESSPPVSPTWNDRRRGEGQGKLLWGGGYGG